MPQTTTDLSPEENKSLLEKKQLTRTQARLYCMELLEIGRTVYYESIYPKLRHYFAPLIIKRDKHGRAIDANVIKISKKKVDEVIALHKKRVEDRAKH